MDNFKYEVASSMELTLSRGYNGDLTAKQSGSIAARWFRRMIESYQRGNK